MQRRFKKNTNWKVNCERMDTEKRNLSTDGDNAVIFNTDSNKYEAWDGFEWVELNEDTVFRYVNTLEELDNIPENKRRKGIIVGVDETNEYYKLKEPQWVYELSDWEILSFERNPRVNEYDLNGGLYQVINHNLGYIPSYVLLDENGTEFETKVTHDLNNLYIRCDFPLLGKIYLK